MLELKPCPFCGGTNLVIDSREMFEEMQAENGCACICVDCKTPGCDANMFEHTHSVTDYDRRVELLVEKWNRRV